MKDVLGFTTAKSGYVSGLGWPTRISLHELDCRTVPSQKVEREVSIASPGSSGHVDGSLVRATTRELMGFCVQP